MTARDGEALCGCQAAEMAFRWGFRAGAEFVLQMADGERGEMAHAVARAVMLSRAVGEPITAALIMGALAEAVETLRTRAALLLESEGRSCWRQALARARPRGERGDAVEAA
jgi:hypothetical protein